MSNHIITEQEVLDAQQAWGEGIVKIGNVFQNEGDYSAAAEEHIGKHSHWTSQPAGQPARQPRTHAPTQPASQPLAGPASHHPASTQPPSSQLAQLSAGCLAAILPAC